LTFDVVISRFDVVISRFDTSYWFQRLVMSFQKIIYFSPLARE
jgi:hypothetical protein